MNVFESRAHHTNQNMYIHMYKTGRNTTHSKVAMAVDMSIVVFAEKQS